MQPEIYGNFRFKKCSVGPHLSIRKNNFASRSLGGRIASLSRSAPQLWMSHSNFVASLMAHSSRLGGRSKERMRHRPDGRECMQRSTKQSYSQTSWLLITTVHTPAPSVTRMCLEGRKYKKDCVQSQRRMVFKSHCMVMEHILCPMCYIDPTKGRSTQNKPHWTRKWEATVKKSSGSFERLKQLWPLVGDKTRRVVMLRQIGKEDVVAALLTNFHTCLRGGVTTDCLGIAPPSLNE